MHVDGAVKGVKLAPAHRLHDLVTREHAPGALGQRHQQIKLVRGQLTGLTRHADHARVAVNLQRAKTQRVACGGCGTLTVAAQHGANARQQFTRLKRLGQVIVGAHFQANDAVHRVTLGSEHQYRCGRQRTRQRADAPTHLQAVDVGQHQVQNHQLHRLVLQRGQATEPVACVRHGVARLAQVFAHHGGQTRVVFDHQQSLVHACSLANVLRWPLSGA